MICFLHGNVTGAIAPQEVKNMAVIWSVEDDESIAALLQEVIQSMGHECLSLKSAQDLQERISAGKPDLLLLDLMLPGKNGFDILNEWKHDPALRTIPVVVISAKSSEVDKVRGLDLGAEDYITKPFGLAELRSRIGAALRRLSTLSNKIKVGALVLEPGERALSVNGQSVTLTQQEYELLLYLAQRPNRLVTRTELMREVWRFEAQTDTSRTIDYHIRALRKKLGDDALHPRFIATVHGSGYRLLNQ